MVGFESHRHRHRPWPEYTPGRGRRGPCA